MSGASHFFSPQIQIHAHNIFAFKIKRLEIMYILGKSYKSETISTIIQTDATPQADS